jgi:hypothetical protein
MKDNIVKILEILLGLIASLVVHIIMFMFRYREFYKWWKNYDGSRYGAYFNLTNTLASNNSPLIFSLSSLFTSPNFQLDKHQRKFVLSMFKFMRIGKGKSQLGHLLPRHLCNSLEFRRTDNDHSFNQWLEDTPNQPRSDFTSLKYDSSGTMMKDDKGDYGVYPSMDDLQSWRFLVMEWLGPGWSWKVDKNGVTHPEADEYNSGRISKWWMNNQGRGDNFLSRINIGPDSPILIYFINDKYSTNSMKVDSIAFRNLLGPDREGGVGGILGYVSKIKSESTDAFNSYIYSSVDTSPIIAKDVCSDKVDALAVSSSVVGSFVTIGMGMALEGPAAVVTVIAGITSGVLGGIKSAQPKC